MLAHYNNSEQLKNKTLTLVINDQVLQNSTSELGASLRVKVYLIMWPASDPTLFTKDTRSPSVGAAAPFVASHLQADNVAELRLSAV